MEKLQIFLGDIIFIKVGEYQGAYKKGYSSLLSFTVDDINNSVTKLLALGAELDGPIKSEIYGKEIFRIPSTLFQSEADRE